jgi:hypothetical protein
MVESCVGDLLGGVLYKDPEDVLEAFVKDYFPNMENQNQGCNIDLCQRQSHQEGGDLGHAHAWLVLPLRQGPV